MDWKRIIGVIGVFIFVGQIYGQSGSGVISCEKALFRDLFKSIHLRTDQRRDDILHLKVIKKQFDHELQVRSLNEYIDNEVHISSIYNKADISCLAIGEAFEIMIVLDRELQLDSLMNLPDSLPDIKSLMVEFSKTLEVSTKLEYLILRLTEPRCVPFPRIDFIAPKSPSQIISAELEKLREPIKLKKTN